MPIADRTVADRTSADRTSADRTAANRITATTVTFARPFRLSGFDQPIPAGSYAVETEEELLPGLSFAAYRRVATWLTLPPRPGGNILAEIAQVDPAELDAALAQDAALARDAAAP